LTTECPHRVRLLQCLGDNLPTGNRGLLNISRWFSRAALAMDTHQDGQAQTAKSSYPKLETEQENQQY